LEDNDTMDDTDTPMWRNDANDAETASAETKMRLALEQLGTRTSSTGGRPGNKFNGAAATARTGPLPRKRFVRDGEVPVERVSTSARPASDAGFELAEERAARQLAEQALADAHGSISRLQMALSRAEQAARAAREAVEERELAMDGLRGELAGARREAALAAAAQAEAEAERRRAEAKERHMPTPAKEPEPVRWWLQRTKPVP
jgi:hypothetical protein